MIIKLLDLCCKAGGCSRGYELAARKLRREIEIVGVDIDPQPNYPYTFYQGDAIDFIKKWGKEFSHIHASPPCQDHSPMTAVHKSYLLSKGEIPTYSEKDIIVPLRIELELLGKPSVMENVFEAPIRPDIVLRGDMFDLRVLRRRKFELVNWFMFNPMIPQKLGSVLNGDYAMVVGKGALTGKGKKGQKASKCKVFGETIKQKWSNAMGIHWMTEYDELSNAIPPKYTEYIGEELFKWTTKN